MNVKIINNPSSGRTTLQKSLANIVGKLVLEGLIRCVDKFDTKGKDDAFKEIMTLENGQYDLILVVGGDGTLNEVVNGVMKKGINTPISIIPAGTVNDFANYLSMPTEINGIYNMFKNNKIVEIDVCKVNKCFFINVAATGLLTDIPLKASVSSKTVFGKFAYYAEGIKEIPKQLFKSIKLEFEIDGKIYKEDVFLFVVLNTSSAGGFRKMAPYAGLNDGKFDVIIFKRSDIFDMATSFFKLIRGEHIEYHHVNYFQTDNLIVRGLNENENINIDIDGENGGPLPAKFEIISPGIKFLVPNKSKL